MGDETGDVTLAVEIHRLLRRLLWATILLYIIVLVITVGGFIYLKAQNDTTTQALCTYRADLQSRVNETNNFLRTHPNGFAGIPASTLRTTAINQQATVNSLSGLNCPPPIPDLAPTNHK